MQHLLNGARWDADALRDDVRGYVAEQLGPGGVLIVDDTGFIKKGTTSAGVSRQYTGTSGKIDNCQIGVFAAYATGRGRALVDRELYLPKCWTKDRERCRTAKIPDERAFATKGEIARDIVRRCVAAGLPASWVTADEAYGQDWSFRRMLEQLGLGYVVAVPKSQQIKSLAGMWRIDALIEQAPADAWETLSCGDGAKGPRVYHWAAAKLPANLIFDPDPPTHHRWVMARRSLSDPSDLAYYLAYAPVDTAVSELARIAGSRWAIEECFQAAKNECGTGRVRSPPLRRVVPAHHVGHARSCLLDRARRPGPGHHKGGRRNDSTSLVPLTVAEIRHLLDALLPHPKPHQDRRLHALNWSHWRRHHQATARRCHYRRRTSSGHDFSLEY
ncbi:IS701 family transposase [Streptantibioticus rubrisoli]|uniref:IS701 family transposase n=1 Tax=Streptantibioticus rubrisoli TaxID=1387313 RepID=UPI00360A6180